MLGKRDGRWSMHINTITSARTDICIEVLMLDFVEKILRSHQK